MKKGLYIFIFFVIVFSCKKRESETVTVIHDCTGQYLRFNNLDHPICNTDKVANIATGTVVWATFVKAGNSSCADRDGIHCMTIHNYPTSNDWIIIKRIK